MCSGMRLQHPAQQVAAEAARCPDALQKIATHGSATSAAQTLGSAGYWTRAAAASCLAAVAAQPPMRSQPSKHCEQASSAQSPQAAC